MQKQKQALERSVSGIILSVIWENKEYSYGQFLLSEILPNCYSQCKVTCIPIFTVVWNLHIHEIIRKIIISFTPNISHKAKKGYYPDQPGHQSFHYS